MDCDCTIDELMTVLLAREVRPDDFVIIGVATPMAAAAVLLAARAYAPDAVIYFYGAINPALKDLSEMLLSPEKLFECASGFLSHSEVIHLQQKGGVGLEFIRPAQVDPFGSVNLSTIGSVEKPRVRLGGSVAVPDSFVQFKRVVLYIPEHSQRTFVETLDFRSAAGHLEGGRWRTRTGILGGGPAKVITNLAVLVFNESTKCMQLDSVHAGVTVEDVITHTGFDLSIPPMVKETDPPTRHDLRLLREEIDRHGIRKMEFRELRGSVADVLANLQR